MRLAGEIVLITGASRGLGEALALAFAAEGARVSICARGREALGRVAERVRAAGGEVLASPLDVTDERAVGDWVEESARQLGAPSVLVNNASLLGDLVPLVDHPVASWRETLEVNLTGSFLAARAVLPHMLEAGRGSIIQVSSGAAVLPRPGWGAYSVSKHAADGMALNLARELRGSGVRVNIVDPGAMRTSMRAAAYPEEDPHRSKPPGEAVGVFLWLASAESAGISGKRFEAEAWP